MFIPTTYSLNDEITRNSVNIANIDENVTSPEVKQSVLDNLLDRRYLLDQKAKHLASVLQAGKNTSINDKDGDILHKDITNLKSRVDSL